MTNSNHPSLHPLLRALKTPVIIVLLLGGTWLILRRTNILPSFSGLFKAKPVLIDNTSLVVTQVKTLALLNTASLYKEMVIDSSIIKQADLPAVFYPFSYSPAPVAYKKEIVLIIKGKVTAGINLKNLPDSNVLVKDDSVSLRLPYPVVTDFFINPSGTETFYEQGKWTNEEVIAVKAIASTRLLEEANRQNLLGKAKDKAAAVLEQFLRASGFTKITIQFY